jgi:hypothetical protein
MSVTLELEAIGWRTAPGSSQSLETEELAVRWKVRQVGIFKEEPEVWTAGGNEPMFHITGRKGEYNSKEDALAALKKEADATSSTKSPAA